MTQAPDPWACPRCGDHQPPPRPFCSNCGLALGAVTAPPVSAPRPNVIRPSSEAPPESGVATGTILGIVVAILAVMAFITIAIIVGGPAIQNLFRLGA
jgi:membrane protease subunit (stomatin/prohibitin family)